MQERTWGNNFFVGKLDGLVVFSDLSRLRPTRVLVGLSPKNVSKRSLSSYIINIFMSHTRALALWQYKLT